MMELHRNDKILIIAVLAVIATFFFFRYVFYFLIGFGVIVGLPVYFLYKSITKKIANIGNHPVTTREKLHANVAQIKFGQSGQRRMRRLVRKMTRPHLR